MPPVFTILTLFGGIALIVGLLALGTHILDNRATALRVRKKRLKALEHGLDAVDQIARDTLTLQPNDITAMQVISAVNKARRAL